MRRYLVVANQTLGGEELANAIQERMAAGPSHFHLLVPATPAGQLDAEYLAGKSDKPDAAAPGTEGLDRKTARQLLEDELEEPDLAESGEDLGRRLARQRLSQEINRMRDLGASVSGEVGVADALDAVGVVLHRWEFDEVILSTLPGRRSRWLAADLPTRIRRGFKLPVTQVTGAGLAQR
ncbi:MAG TPA: hypothetical protein VFU54_07455 [Actinomycetota bacterium]|nr:hypothetical protein [Actinomycetota bacterium]